MTSVTPHGHPVSGILAGELVALRAFVALLKTEQTALVDGNTDGLNALIDEKSALATRLTEAAQCREAALAAAQLPPARAGMEAWLATLPATDAARRDWPELLSLAAEARSLNELNGRLIGTRLQGNQQALAALMSATERAMTYGPDGQTAARAGGGRVLGSA